MKSVLFAMAAFAALVTTAQAEPWKSEVTELPEGPVGQVAYQWADAESNILLGYECDAAWALDAFYVQTGERYVETASYAEDVPTTFAIDGQVLEVTGAVQNREGYLFVYYDAVEIESFTELFDTMIVATNSIELSFFDLRFSFSPEGISEALGNSSKGCA